MGHGPEKVIGKSAPLAAAACAFANAAFAACGADEVHLRGDWGTARFEVEVADEPAERAEGLMFVESMPRSSGMLFVFEREKPLSFWMRNTLIPLDMIAFDGSGTATRVHAGAVPLDETPIPLGGAVKFVLEVNGGTAAALGVSEGTEMRHPSIGAAAAWPCGG